MTERRTRILMVHPSADLYGSDRMFLRTVALVRSRAEVVVALPVRGPLADEVAEVADELRVVPFPVLRRADLRPRRLPGLVVGWLRGLAAAIATIRSGGFDVVYVNTVVAPVWVVCARLLGVPVVCHVRENEPDMSTLVQRLLLSPLLLAHEVLANSRSTGEWIRSAYAKVDVKVIYNGIELPEAHALPSRESLRVVLVGRLSRRKGQDVAIQAVALLRAAGLDVDLDLVGDVYQGYEWYEQELRSLVETCQLADHVVFHGFQRDPKPFVENAYAVLVPSRLEPFGTVAVEAMAGGRAVIASDVQGLAEVVDDGVTGWLVQPGDARALADAVLRTVSDTGRYSHMCAAAAVDARARFSLARYASDVSLVLAKYSGPPDGGPGRGGG